MERKTSNLFLVMIVFLVLSLYIPINRLTNSSGHIYNFRIDARIPFIPMAILPYLSFFLLMPWTLFVFLAERERLYREMAYSIMSACVVSYTAYFLYQTTIIRPNVASMGFINELVALVYMIDPPYSCFPSLHTSISTILAVYWLRSPSRVKYFVLPWSLTIILSTLMTKQHHLLDVIGGIALGAVISLVAAKLHRVSQGERAISTAESELGKIQLPSSSS
jgi:membrane-associated phospholipid phosphatase